jgi:hypothetical protein
MPISAILFASMPGLPSEGHLDVDPVPVFEAEGASEVALADNLDGVHVMGPLRDYYGAVDVADLRLVRDDVPEAPAVADEPLHEAPGGAPYDLQLAYVLRVHPDVEGPLVGGEAQDGLELPHVPFLADVVLALPHARGDRAVDGDLVRKLEDAAVLVVLPLHLLYALGGYLDALPSGAEVPDDVFLVQKLQDPLGGRLLAHVQGRSELAGGDGDVVVDGPHQGQLPQREGVLVAHVRTYIRSQ